MSRGFCFLSLDASVGVWSGTLGSVGCKVGILVMLVLVLWYKLDLSEFDKYWLRPPLVALGLFWLLRLPAILIDPGDLLPSG